MKKKKPLSPAQKALVHSQVDTRVDIVEDIVAPIGTGAMVGCIAATLFTFAAIMLVPDFAANFGITKESYWPVWILTTGGIAGALVGTKVAAPSLNEIRQLRHPRLKGLENRELAHVIDTALVELPAGFQWTYEEGRIGNGVLGIALDDGSPMINVGLDIHQTQNPPLDMSGSTRRNAYVNSDDGFAASLEYAASLLHDFLVATKHLSKDPVRAGDHDPRTVLIKRHHQRHEDHDMVTGTMMLADKPGQTEEIAQVVILHDHTENISARLVAVLFPIWARMHHEINHSAIEKARKTEQLGAQAAAGFLVDSALREVSQSPQPTDEDILRELG